VSVGELAGARVLVVGASAGIGRAFAVGAAAAGARVVVSARRGDRLAEVVDQMGGGHAVLADVAVEDECVRMVDEAAAELGSLDLVFYAVGFARLRRMVDANREDWQSVFAANLFGLQAVVRAALPHLVWRGIVAALSSEMADHPRTALGVYGASKAALDHSLANWRLENSDRRFTSVAVGATQPTEFGREFELDVLEPVLGDWFRHGTMQQEYMETDDVAGFLVATLGAALRFPGIGLDHLVVRSPSPVVALPDRRAEP
jgi:NADP-dependent 3-hydroxy acid dehydrogenase YdfG